MAKQTKPAKQTEILKPRFNVAYEQNHHSKGKECMGASETLPDMSLGIKDLLKHHTTGTNPNVRIQQPIYVNQEIPQFDDITERHEYIEKLKNQIKFHENEQKKIDQAKLDQLEPKKPSENEVEEN